jgi:DNA-binding response OmpR family regulator
MSKVSSNEGKETARGLRVLIVDDCRDAADSLGLLLQLWGYDFRLAYSPDEALKTAASWDPDVALLDVGLPSMDGYALACRITLARGGKGPTLVALTGYADEAHRVRARTAGFDHYLIKPYEPRQLEKLLDVLGGNGATRLSGSTTRALNVEDGTNR